MDKCTQLLMQAELLVNMRNTMVLEALVVVWAVKHFMPYLFGHRCTVYTNQSPLRSILMTQHPSGKFARWRLALVELALEIKYRPCRINVNADDLSGIQRRILSKLKCLALLLIVTSS